MRYSRRHGTHWRGGARWRPRADLRFGSTRRRGERYAEVWLRPLKKKTGDHTPKIPQYAKEFDGGGADTYRALRRQEKYDPVSRHRRATTLMFRTTEQGGRRSQFSTAKLRELVRRRMRQIGERRPREWGGTEREDRRGDRPRLDGPATAAHPAGGRQMGVGHWQDLCLGDQAVPVGSFPADAQGTRQGPGGDDAGLLTAGMKGTTARHHANKTSRQT